MSFCKVFETAAHSSWCAYAKLSSLEPKPTKSDKAAEERKALEAEAGESANLQMGSMQLEAAAVDESEDNP